MPSPFPLLWRSRLVAACAIGLAVWLLRVALVGDLGTGIPWMDQWDCEGLNIYEPWIEGKLSWNAIFAPYYEHRIAWTHLWNIGLLELCGQWDPMVQMIAQAAITALTAALCVGGLLAVQGGMLWRSAVLMGATIAFGAPLAYQNILWGFQSCFALLVAFSLGVCAAAALAWEKKRYAWLALLPGLAAPLAMGAGALAGPIIIALTILVMCCERKITRRSKELLAVGLVCLVWALWLRSNVPPRDFTRAKSISEFMKVWLAACAWPNSQNSWLAGLACMPVGLLILQLLRKAVLPRPHELFIVGVFIWTLASAAGGAWTRGALGVIPPSRYCDFLALLCWVNLLAVLLVLPAWWRAGGATIRVLGAMVTVAWFASALYGGLGLLERFVQTDRPAWQNSSAQQFEEANSALVGLSTAAAVRTKLGKQPMAYEQVMESRILAPFLPPEIRVPCAGITPDDSFALGLADATAGWQWQSGYYDVRMPAMTMFVRGDAKELALTVVNQAGETKTEFLPSGRHIGQWSEWLVRPAPGRYRLHIKTAFASGGSAVILPRPLSAAGYWVRWIAADWARLVELAGIGLAVALLVCWPKMGAAENNSQLTQRDE